MEINKFTNFIKDPVLYYKLDPGEPGLATPTNASQSIARVAMHEGGNIMRFRKEANEKGGIVVYSYIYLNLKYAGSFLAATAGRSEALIIYPAEKSGNKKDINNPKEINAFDKNRDIVNSLKKDVDSMDNQTSGTDKINKENNKISVNKNDKLSEIDNQIKKLEDEKSSLKNASNAYNFEEKSIEEKSKIDEIEKKIQILELEKQSEKQKEFLLSLTRNYDIARKLVALNFSNLSRNPEGNLIDTIV